MSWATFRGSRSARPRLLDPPPPTRFKRAHELSLGDRVMPSGRAWDVCRLEYYGGDVRCECYKPDSGRASVEPFVWTWNQRVEVAA